MIETTGGRFVIEDDSEQQFNGSSIICEPTYIELQESFAVRLNVVDSVTTTVLAYGYLTVTKTEVDAETGSGTGETAPWFSALQEAVITKLEALTGNGSITFTVV
jgi:predicted transcriptional regulator